MPPEPQRAEEGVEVTFTPKGPRFAFTAPWKWFLLGSAVVVAFLLGYRIGQPLLEMVTGHDAAASSLPGSEVLDHERRHIATEQSLAETRGELHGISTRLDDIHALQLQILATPPARPAAR